MKAAVSIRPPHHFSRSSGIRHPPRPSFDIATCDVKAAYSFRARKLTFEVSLKVAKSTLRVKDSICNEGFQFSFSVSVFRSFLPSFGILSTFGLLCESVWAHSSTSTSMNILKEIERRNHEQVVFCSDKRCGLQAIIAIHNTALGPALGGTRMWTYASD